MRPNSSKPTAEGGGLREKIEDVVGCPIYPPCEVYPDKGERHLLPVQIPVVVKTFYLEARSITTYAVIGEIVGKDSGHCVHLRERQYPLVMYHVMCHASSVLA